MSKTQPMRSSGVIASQKSVETASISDGLRATPPVQVRRRSSARALDSDTIPIV
jgi:hypothetical protein